MGVNNKRYVPYTIQYQSPINAFITLVSIPLATIYEDNIFVKDGHVTNRIGAKPAGRGGSICEKKALYDGKARREGGAAAGI